MEQFQTVKRWRDYIADLQDEQQWQRSFGTSQDSLIVAARAAKQAIAEGEAKPMDYAKL